jgi:beta-galactosidase
VMSNRKAGHLSRSEYVQKHSRSDGRWKSAWTLASRTAPAWMCTVLLAVSVGAGAQAVPAGSPQPRIRQNLNAGWLFERQDHGTGELGSFDRDIAEASKIEPRFKDASTVAYDDSSWSPIDLPHTWNAHDVSDEQPGYWRGIGWYRKHFRVDPKYAGKRIVLEFEGANQTAEVWLNGKYLGKHKGGYTPFAFQIAPQFDQDNVLTVKVDNLYDPTVPPTVKTDYSFYGGIYRSVSLLITATTYVSDMYWTTPSVSRSTAQADFHSEVKNDSDHAMQLTLTQEIVDPQGKVIDTVSTPVTVEGEHAKSIVQSSGTLNNPQLWSPETPNLYHIRTSLKEGTQLLDLCENPLGFRWYRFDPQQGFFLNGSRLEIHGTNMHQSYPGMGNAVPKSRLVKDVEVAHDMGVNFWRTSHYPHNIAMMDASDRLGMMVWEELPINKEIGNTEQYIANVSNMAREMIQRDRNHPSVLLWGIAGEINAPTAVSRQVVGTITSLYHQLDSTRPVVMHAPRGEEIASLVDIVGESPSAETDQEHLQHPQRPYMTGEYSAALIERGRYGAGPYSEENGLANHEKYLRMLNQRTWMAGGCIWNEFDYDGETYDPVVPHMVSFGMTDIWRIPKEAYYFYQSQWSPTPMVHIVGHWTFPGEEGKMRTVQILSNQKTVELFLNGKSMGSKVDATDTGLPHPPRIWTIPYEAGSLTAVAKTGNSEIKDEQRTAGPAYKIVLESDASVLTSGNPESLAYITASVADQSGTIVPGSHPAITFTSYGPGKLLEQTWLGHGTGLTWNAVDGRTRVAFRSTPRSGRAVISAYSPGLLTGRVSVTVTGPGKHDEMNYIDLDRNDELQ